MPRTLSFNLDHIMVNSASREPAWDLRIYDVRSTTDTINDVVLFNAFGTGALLALTGPRDFTADAVSIQINETRGDYVNGGVQASVVDVNLVDEHGLYDPLLILGLDPASQEYADTVGRFLRAGNVVVLRLGDQRVEKVEWVYVFTGEIVGQAGRRRSRSDGAQSDLTFQALGRESRHLQYERTSDDFGGSKKFIDAAKDIAQDQMGLDLAEIDFGGWGNQSFNHQSVQFVEEPPLVMLAQLMFPDGFLPKFDGRGILTEVSSLIVGGANRAYDNLDIIRKIDRPYSNIEQPNCVIVLGLDKNLTKVTHPHQRLATVDITTGFFSNDEDFEVYWAEDKTLIAENIETRILKSVNGGINFLGGEEEFTELPAPGPGGGTIGMHVYVTTGFAPWLVTFFLIIYIVFAIISDLVVYSLTVSIGRLIQAIVLAAALYIMTKIGRGQYEFLGAPIEYVYKEVKGRACVDGASEFEENSVTIENHLINTQSDANDAAMQTLFLLQAEENPREVDMLHDLKLEVDDIFSIPGDRLFLIDTISYVLVRSDQAIKTGMSCFEVTPGVVA